MTEYEKLLQTMDPMIREEWNLLLNMRRGASKELAAAKAIFTEADNAVSEFDKKHKIIKQVLNLA